jgi:hypothetical protein
MCTTTTAVYVSWTGWDAEENNAADKDIILYTTHVCASCQVDACYICFEGLGASRQTRVGRQYLKEIRNMHASVGSNTKFQVV